MQKKLGGKNQIFVDRDQFQIHGRFTHFVSANSKKNNLKGSK